MPAREELSVRDSSGANLVEFALVFLLLLLLLAAIADLGRGFYTYIAVANSAREGVRYYSRLPCMAADASQRNALYTAVRDAVVNEAAASGINLSNGDALIELNPDPRSACPAKGSPVRVHVVYTFRSMIGFVPMLSGDRFSFGAIPLGHVATMVSFGNDTP